MAGDIEGSPPATATGLADQFSIGAEVSCTDGACAQLAWVVVDPVGRILTHLVVEPRHRSGVGRLVPVDLVADAGEQIGLSCNMEQFEELEPAEETQFLPWAGQMRAPGTDAPGTGTGKAFGWPYYGLGMGGLGSPGGIGTMSGLGVGNAPQAIIYDKVPVGEVQVRRGQRVEARDGEIGSVQGLVIEPGEHHVTHVLLAEGHLWGRKQVAIPIRLVTSVKDGISVALTKQEVKDLPPVELASD